MGKILNNDFEEFLQALNLENVEYILVGGYAVIFYGYNRTTGDLDVWVNPTLSNYEKLQAAFLRFGLPTMAISPEDFLNSQETDVFTFGRPPVSIDILTQVKGLAFDQSFQQSSFQQFDGVEVRIIDYRDLIIAKKSANRSKDKNDLEHLDKRD